LWGVGLCPAADRGWAVHLALLTLASCRLSRSRVVDRYHGSEQSGASSAAGLRGDRLPAGGAGNGPVHQALLPLEHDAGTPGLGGWLATVFDDPDGRPACAVDGCELLVESTDPGLCRSHVHRWRTRGRPPQEWFVIECATFADPVFDLRELPCPLRLEVAYGLQCRHDDHRAKTHAKPLKPLLGLLATSGASSLLERPVEVWLAELLPISRWGSVPRSFVRSGLSI
jgi:hypothetical protein